jgi:hypothetical protein
MNIRIVVEGRQKRWAGNEPAERAAPHDAVLLDVVKALRRRVRRVSHDYDIPYIAGYSVDGKNDFY